MKSKSDGMSEVNWKQFDAQLRNEARFKACIFYDISQCSGKIINGHSIAKSKILDTLSDEFVFVPEINSGPYQTNSPMNKTVMDLLSPELGLPNVNISRVTKSSASTSNVFCAKHDQSLFSIIDQNSFEKTEEQIFQYSYRAFSKEYSAVQRTKQMYDKFPVPKNADISRFKKVLSDMNRTKQKFDEAYVKGEFGIFSCFYHELPYEVNLATSTCYNPPVDFRGKNVVDLYAMNEERNPAIFLNVFPEKGKTVIVFSYFKSDDAVFKEYFDQLEVMSTKKNFFRRIMNFILVTHPENIVFGEKLNHYMEAAGKWDYFKSDYAQFSFLPMFQIGEPGVLSNLLYFENQQVKLKYNLLKET